MSIYVILTSQLKSSYGFVSPTSGIKAHDSVQQGVQGPFHNWSRNCHFFKGKFMPLFFVYLTDIFFIIIYIYIYILYCYLRRTFWPSLIIKLGSFMCGHKPTTGRVAILDLNLFLGIKLVI